eukprot:8655671-Lingulodinium_polyedra.AAC.1
MEQGTHNKQASRGSKRGATEDCTGDTAHDARNMCTRRFATRVQCTALPWCDTRAWCMRRSRRGNLEQYNRLNSHQTPACATL